MTRIEAAFANLIGQHIPGGCLDCHAVQTIHRDHAGLWHLTVHHDATCPTWRSIRRRREQ